MNIYADYHTHTVYSHGRGTIEQNVIEALKKGLKKIAVTDHGPGHIGFGIKARSFKLIRDEIDTIKEKYKDIEVLMGVEANLTSMEGDIDVPHQYLGMLDILLMGYHKLVMPVSLRDWSKLFLKNTFFKGTARYYENIKNANTKAMIKALNRYEIDIITHPGAKIPIDTVELAKEAGKRGTALEINAHHGYLSYEYLKLAMKQDVKFVISSDAHRPKDVGNFAKGIMIARQAGLTAERIINAY